jgi:hypothetical protein
LALVSKLRKQILSVSLTLPSRKTHAVVMRDNSAFASLADGMSLLPAE